MPYKAHIKKPAYTYLPGMVIGSEEIPLGASGAIATAGATTTENGTGILSIVKTAAKTGRYTITFAKRYRRLQYLHASIVGSADTAYPVANGIICHLRNDAVTSAGTIDIQFSRSDTGVDAEPINSGVIKLTFIVKDSTTGK